MKRTLLRTLALGVLLAPTAALAQSPAAAPPAAVAAPAGPSAVVSAYLKQETQAVLVIDLAQVNLDEAMAYLTAKAKASNVPQADIDKAAAEAEPKIADARKVLAVMTDAGATKVYGFLSISGAVMNDFGTVAIPAASPEKAQKVAEQLTGWIAGQPQLDGLGKVTTAGPVVLFQSKQAAAAPGGAPNAVLVAAMNDQTAPAAVRLLVDARILAEGGPPPEDQKLIDATDWMSIAINVPPRSSFAAVLRCKDAASAQKVADRLKAELTTARTNESVKGVLGDPTALFDAMMPKVDGASITISLDAKTLEDVVAPAIARVAASLNGKPAKN